MVVAGVHDHDQRSVGTERQEDPRDEASRFGAHGHDHSVVGRGGAGGRARRDRLVRASPELATRLLDAVTVAAASAGEDPDEEEPDDRREHALHGIRE
jgi:hypothetical protein